MPMTCGARRGEIMTSSPSGPNAGDRRSRTSARAACTACRRRTRPATRRSVIDEFALGGDTDVGAVLQLVAVDGVRRGRRRAVGARDRQPQQQAELAVAGRGGGAAAVAEVARRARLGVERRAEAVTGIGGRRGRHPVLGEEAVADLELTTLVVGQRRRRKAECVAAGDLACGVAAERRRRSTATVDATPSATHDDDEQTTWPT